MLAAFALSLFLAVGVVPGGGEEERVDAPLAALVGEVVKLADPSSGITAGEQELSERLAEYDDTDVVEALLPLLEHEEDKVRDLTGYLIREFDSGVGLQHFAALKSGYERGATWLPRAIVKSGAEEAAAFIVAEFRKKPAFHSQPGWALVQLGERAVEPLCVEFKAADPEKEARFFSELRTVLKRMGASASGAVPRLLEIAESDEFDFKVREQAIRSIGSIAVAEDFRFPRLQALAEGDAARFGEVVEDAIASSRTHAAAVLLADGVDAGKTTIRSIAMLGELAGGVGERVVGWLEHDDWEKRVAAVRALGAIGYGGAREHLEGLLKSEKDWRMAFSAVHALEELGDKRAVEALRLAAKNHWFRVVRDAADAAVAALEKGETLPNERGGRASDLVSHVFVYRDEYSIDEGQLKGLGVRNVEKGKVGTFAEFSKREPKLAQKFIELRATNGEGLLKQWGGMITRRFGDGVLMGARAGEWVGGLQYAPDDGEQVSVYFENIVGIEEWRGDVITVSGTWHMGMNEGMLHKVEWQNGQLALKPWFALPGSPSQTWQTDAGELVVQCVGGTVVFGGAEEFRYFSSDPPPEAEGDEAEGGEGRILEGLEWEEGELFGE